MAEAQFVFSNGVTTYSILFGALVITVVLQILQWLVCLIFKGFPDKWYAISYFPSFLFFSIITDVNRNVFDSFSWGSWKWFAPLALLLFVLFALFIKKRSGAEDSSSLISMSLWPNFLILLVMILCTGSIPSTTDVYHYELKTERLIMSGEYEEACKVGAKSLASSRRLTELRAYALAARGELGEKLFDFPQYYGANGLLDVCDSLGHYRFDCRDICASLGFRCGKSVKTFGRYIELAVAADTLQRQPLGDYYLCSLLLDKDLSTFEKELSRYYAPDQFLPKAYKEALLINYDMSSDSIPQYADTVLLAGLREYRQMKEELSDARERVNRTRRKFGKTYWWYYDYSDEVEKEEY
ncbi:MAG: DUF6057 family protein [Bacteroides sp.]|nr:DUF6057 family protein [Roseburia sp.]MCM1345578.1 DUF6057 family protein [Bacteroides sp.]MCM1421267.1 DUF6057 family protein [Bacteroides sp.]